MGKNPMAEVFGFPTSNQSVKAVDYRKNRLCPFGNIAPNCTKDKANNPLGVCSINHGEHQIITCPVRFREDWVIIRNAATMFCRPNLCYRDKTRGGSPAVLLARLLLLPPRFAFGEGAKWTSVSEVKLLDADGKSAGNIDYVVIQLDAQGDIVDFASVEVQGVYISGAKAPRVLHSSPKNSTKLDEAAQEGKAGNLRNAFSEYMESGSIDFEWNGKNYPHPDYLSSSRKRLVPQLLYKGGIFKSWGKKQCVVIQKQFYETLPMLPRVEQGKADIAWFLYDLQFDSQNNLYHIGLSETIYTEFTSALSAVITPKPGKLCDFVDTLQSKLEAKATVPPDRPVTILDSITE